MDNSNKVLGEHQEVTNLKKYSVDIFRRSEHGHQSASFMLFLPHKTVLIKKTVLSSWYEKLMPLCHILAANFWFKL